ncbi:MAG: hypothetical protein JJU11_07550 [Candidatus Sumerlaeia bacterium]|nr:hypothetical protein [Candidatus Sumerlaeia bacterium]
MTRPVPNSKYLTTLALQVQRQFRSGLPGASLLAATPSSNYSLLLDAKNRQFFVLDRAGGRILHPLDIPPRSRQASDFDDFVFSPSGNTVAAYNSRDCSFAIWSLDEGRLLCHFDGEGEIPGRIAFLDEERIVTADSHRLSTRNLAGKEIHGTRLPEETRDLLMFPMVGADPVLVVVAVVQRKNLGAHIHCFRIIKGRIDVRAEGPYRERAQSPRESKTIRLRELLNIPGSTDNSLVLCDEEILQISPASPDGIHLEEFRTRVNAINPQKGTFYEGEITMTGRHCLEIYERELHLVDEHGRYRRVHCFPLAVENADWRLEGSGLEPSW